MFVCLQMRSRNSQGGRGDKEQGRQGATEQNGSVRKYGMNWKSSSRVGR
jgi:hypothetical protein